MESQTLTSATVSRSESVGSLLNERSYDAAPQSPSTLRLTYSPKLESDLPYSSDNQHDKNQIVTDKSERIFLLPGTEQIVKVIKKFTISENGNKEYIERDNEEVFYNINNDEDNEQDLNGFRKNQHTNKTEHKYYRTNVLHKRQRVLHRSNRSHHERHHHRRHQRNQSHDYIDGLQSSEQSQSPVRRESVEKSKYTKYKKPVTSVQSSVTYDPYNNEQKRVISRLNLIAPGPAQSSDLNENEVISTDGFHDTSHDVQSYLNSQNRNVGLSELKQNRLFLPTKTNKKNRNKYKNHSRRNEYESHHEKSHSSLNRLCSHTPYNSGACRKCNVICSKCNESIHHLNHYNSDSRSLHRADMYCDRRLRGVSCSSLDHECQLNSSRRYRSLSGSKMVIPSGHHHHYQPHRHICCAKSIPSLSTLDFYDTNSIYTHSLDSNRHINFIEIEYMQVDNGDNDNENLPIGLSKEKLNWITNLARESLNKTKDLDSLAKLMKETLDEHFGKIWHSIVGTESYGSHLATLPGTLVSFRIDKWAFLLWQT
ncbi:hypothetical protein MS3_00005663 [Schistosoma haematobium]|uniref:Uncharacterized protein n=1 Tax=Schistosoma haematobium TaxID=6185 RepID=A0A095CBR2_SCHHA|nr:hypothetical protein MS3_00005663 [Schistosoma haematobium]KAH9588187.1 hypothetical protein MS3_00005663 [Schistosoma haematobium]CAH8560763.1 unnamed protein product [Schistosoma haematobium]CAH8565265.1 unnamed protein product [Schistosoma haematobium]